MSILRDKSGRFQKGTVANPYGRSGKKRLKLLAANDISLTEEILKILLQEAPNGKPYIELLALKVVTEAMKGNNNMLIELWNRIDGKAGSEKYQDKQQDVNININIENEQNKQVLIRELAIIRSARERIQKAIMASDQSESGIN